MTEKLRFEITELESESEEVIVMDCIAQVMKRYEDKLTNSGRFRVADWFHKKYTSEDHITTSFTKAES